MTLPDLKTLTRYAPDAWGQMIKVKIGDVWDEEPAHLYLRERDVVAFLQRLRVLAPPEEQDIRIGTKRCCDCGTLLIWLQSWQGWDCVACNRRELWQFIEQSAASDAPERDTRLLTLDYNVIAEAVKERLGYDISTRAQQDQIVGWARRLASAELASPRASAAPEPTCEWTSVVEQDIERMRRRVFNYVNEEYDDDHSYAVDIMEDFLKMLGTTRPRTEADFGRAAVDHPPPASDAPERDTRQRPFNWPPDKGAKPSKWCKGDDKESHGWCMNRNPSECHCTCNCHKRLASPRASAATEPSLDLLRAMVERDCRFNCDAESSCTCDAHEAYRFALKWSAALSSPSPAPPADTETPPDKEQP